MCPSQMWFSFIPEPCLLPGYNQSFEFAVKLCSATDWLGDFRCDPHVTEF